MYALTIWQPWASLIACGAKRYETRSWAAPHRVIGQRLAIHAGLRGLRRSELGYPLAALREYGLDYRDLPRGVVVATAYVVACLRTCDPPKYIPWQERLLGDWSPGRWAWQLEDVVQVEPSKVRGAQGLWIWREKGD